MKMVTATLSTCGHTREVSTAETVGSAVHCDKCPKYPWREVVSLTDRRSGKERRTDELIDQRSGKDRRKA